MLCPYCQIDLMIDHTGYLAEGDTSAREVTRVFLSPYFRCPNPSCQHHTELLEGDRILVHEGAAPHVQA